MILQQSMYIFRSIYTLLFLGLPMMTSLAQESDDLADSLLIVAQDDSASVHLLMPVEPQDTIPPKKFLSGAELGIDYGKLLTLWTEFESKYEANINIRFYERIVLAGEMGYAELNPLKAYDNALYYTVKGVYGRVGLDYYTSYDPTSFYYAGLRYGMSNFEDEGAFLIDSEFWEDYEEGFGSKDITASWFELVVGTETYLKFGKKEEGDDASKFLLGWKFRLRFLMDFQNREEPRIYSIPGYGRTFDQVVPALNLYVKYRLGN